MAETYREERGTRESSKGVTDMLILDIFPGYITGNYLWYVLGINIHEQSQIAFLRL